MARWSPARPEEDRDLLAQVLPRALIGAAGVVALVAEPTSLREFFVGNARRLGTAGKILFPIPNRRLSTRVYRLITETLIVWAEDDRLVPSA
jgi:hypothetical protein